MLVVSEKRGGALAPSLFIGEEVDCEYEAAERFGVGCDGGGCSGWIAILHGCCTGDQAVDRVALRRDGTRDGERRGDPERRADRGRAGDFPALRNRRKLCVVIGGGCGGECIPRHGRDCCVRSRGDEGCAGRQGGQGVCGQGACGAGAAAGRRRSDVCGHVSRWQAVPVGRDAGGCGGGLRPGADGGEAEVSVGCGAGGRLARSVRGGRGAGRGVSCARRRRQAGGGVQDRRPTHSLPADGGGRDAVGGQRRQRGDLPAEDDGDGPGGQAVCGVLGRQARDYRAGDGCGGQRVRGGCGDAAGGGDQRSGTSAVAGDGRGGRDDHIFAAGVGECSQCEHADSGGVGDLPHCFRWQPGETAGAEGRRGLRADGTPRQPAGGHRQSWAHLPCGYGRGGTVCG